MKPVILTILDGWGLREEEANNAPKLANTPTMDRLMADLPGMPSMPSVNSIIDAGWESPAPPGAGGPGRTLAFSV